MLLLSPFWTRFDAFLAQEKSLCYWENKISIKCQLNGDYLKRKKKLITLFQRQEVLGCFLYPFLTSWLPSFATSKGHYFLASKDRALYLTAILRILQWTDKPRFIIFLDIFFFMMWMLTWVRQSEQKCQTSGFKFDASLKNVKLT